MLPSSHFTSSTQCDFRTQLVSFSSQEAQTSDLGTTIKNLYDMLICARKVSAYLLFHIGNYEVAIATFVRVKNGRKTPAVSFEKNSSLV